MRPTRRGIAKASVYAKAIKGIRSGKIRSPNDIILYVEGTLSPSDARDLFTQIAQNEGMRISDDIFEVQRGLDNTIKSVQAAKLDLDSSVSRSKEATWGLQSEERNAEGVRKLLARDVKSARELERDTERYTQLKNKVEELASNIRLLDKHYQETAKKFLRMDNSVKERVSYYMEQFAQIDSRAQQRSETLEKIDPGGLTNWLWILES
jgi:predicted  nucleic acid-binding Zn-ribbon protein